MSSRDLLDRTSQYQIRDPYLSTFSAITDPRLLPHLRPPLAPPHSSRFSPPLSTANRNEARPPSRRAAHLSVPHPLHQLEPLLSESDRRAFRRHFGHRLDEIQDGGRGDAASSASPLSHSFSPLGGTHGVAPPPPPPPMGPSRAPPPAPTSRRSSPPPAPAFRVTVSCEGPSDDEEDPSSPEILLDRQRRRNGMESSSEDDEDDEGGLAAAAPSSSRRARLRVTPRRIEWLDKGADGGGGGNGEPLEPLARFFISRKKHVVTMHFEPAV